MPNEPVLVWFRDDLRLADNPALSAAAASGRPVIALFVLDDEAPARWLLGGAARWWLHHSLAALDRSLGGRLTLRVGSAEDVILDLAGQHAVAAVFWNRRYTPWGSAQDRRVAERLRGAGVEVRDFKAALLLEPWEVPQGEDRREVFTPFHRSWQARLSSEPPLPVPRPETLKLAGLDLAGLALLPTAPDWAGGLRATWRPGEGRAHELLGRFAGRVGTYQESRDRPADEAVSRLSPRLRFGELSPRQILHAVRGESADAFVRQLAWREFAHHLLWRHPDLPEHPLDRTFEGFGWRADVAGLRAWQRGRTGLPIVDAGMRELWATGYMHNRVRMIVGSFLTKDLLLDWRQGEAWFWDTLVDADLANNAMGWQWIAGCGTDPTGFARIFSPAEQSRRCDPDGSYIRRWVPELRALAAPWVHAPELAPEPVLARAGLGLGAGYPRPILDHRAARHRAIVAHDALIGRRRGAISQLRLALDG